MITSPIHKATTEVETKDVVRPPEVMLCSESVTEKPSADQQDLEKLSLSEGPLIPSEDSSLQDHIAKIPSPLLLSEGSLELTDHDPVIPPKQTMDQAVMTAPLSDLDLTDHHSSKKSSTSSSSAVAMSSSSSASLSLQTSQSSSKDIEFSEGQVLLSSLDLSEGEIGRPQKKDHSITTRPMTPDDSESS